MALLGPKLIGPKIAAWLLALYALGYSLFLLGLLLMAFDSTEGFLMFSAMFGLALTPFFAIYNLSKLQKQPVRPVWMPPVMAVVMLAPTAFWTYASMDLLTPRTIGRAQDFLLLFGFVAVPAILSVWLAATFAIATFRPPKGEPHGQADRDT